MAPAGQKFSKALASNDKAIRDKTLESLRLFLSKKGPSLTRKDLMKLWKGLFYCMWMSDKIPVQQELAQAIAELVHCFGSFAAGAGYARAFFLTMQREWSGIDHLRLDKFYSLMRKVVREVLVALSNGGWDEAECEAFARLVSEEVLHGGGPGGVRYHVADVMVPELCKVDALVSTSAVMTLLSPFFKVLGSPPSNEKPMFEHCVKTVFQPLANEYLPTQGSEQEPEVFRRLDLMAVSDMLFSIAADSTEVSSEQRGTLYDLRSSFRSAAKISTAVVDAAPAAPAKPKAKAKAKPKKKAKKAVMVVEVEEAAPMEEAAAEEKEAPAAAAKPKGKKRKKKERRKAAAAAAPRGKKAVPITSAAAAAEEKRVRFKLSRNVAVDAKTSKARLATHIAGREPSAQVSPPVAGVLKPSPIQLDEESGLPIKKRKSRRAGKKKGRRPSAADFF